jgi:rhodanese-related sulfurtransferase
VLQGGSRSAMAASIQHQSGRDEIPNMDGGFAEWEQSANTVVLGNGAG